MEAWLVKTKTRWPRSASPFASEKPISPSPCDSWSVKTLGAILMKREIGLSLLLNAMSFFYHDRVKSAHAETGGRRLTGSGWLPVRRRRRADCRAPVLLLLVH